MQGDRAQAQRSLETCLGMRRGLEQHVSIDANWQVGDFCFLRRSSQGAGGEEAGGKATQVWGWTGREGWEDPGMRGQGGAKEATQVAKGEAGTGVGSSNQATPPQVLAGLPVDLSVKARLRALEQVAPGIPGPELTLRERYF